VFGAEEVDELIYFVGGEGVFEGGHFLTAVLDLIDDLWGFEGLANVGQ
jgi:hypothetical protein